MENRTAALVIATQAVGSIAEAQGPVQVLAYNHAAPRQRSPPAHGFDLQSQVLKADRVVAVHRALELQRKDALQVFPPIGHKGSARLRRCYLEAAIELPDVMLAQKDVRRLHRPDPTQAQFLRQPALPGAEAAFAPSPRLRRVGGNHAYSQLAQRPPHLRETVVVHASPALVVSQK